MYPEWSRSAFKILTGKPLGKRTVEDLIIDGKTILEWILKT